MTDRAFRRHVAAIFAVAFLAVIAAAAIGAFSLHLDTQVNDFYATDTGNGAASNPEYEAINDLATLSYALRGMTAPLVFAAVVSVFIALGVLAVRWRNQHDPRRADASGPA